MNINQIPTTLRSLCDLRKTILMRLNDIAEVAFKKYEVLWNFCRCQSVLGIYLTGEYWNVSSVLFPD